MWWYDGKWRSNSWWSMVGNGFYKFNQQTFTTVEQGQKPMRKPAVIEQAAALDASGGQNFRPFCNINAGWASRYSMLVEERCRLVSAQNSNLYVSCWTCKHPKVLGYIIQKSTVLSFNGCVPDHWQYWGKARGPHWSVCVWIPSSIVTSQAASLLGFPPDTAVPSSPESAEVCLWLNC